jgi:hypothetical protein
MDHDHEELADQLDSDAQKMKDRADTLGEEIGDVREDWRQKQQDSGVPGAEPPADEGEDGPDAESSASR